MLLTRLGVPKLWREDPERLWTCMRSFVGPATLWLAPSSYAYGVERVPQAGGAALAANHLSAIDPPLLGTFCPRAIYYMAKAELLATPLVGELLQWTGAFPVRRGEHDEQALVTARRLVRQGHVVCFFVEGTRQRLGYPFSHPGRFHHGGMIVAIEEQVPVIPCGVESFRWSLRNRRACAVVWGDPIDLSGLSGERGYREAGEIVRAELIRLWRQAAEAVTSGFPPELADRTRRSARIPPRWRPAENIGDTATAH